ncbi:hypothetical protein BKA65DRAFT_481757 [Rhexocercosporidium sp. MPI-PUGE-AT-0058]|nr:hypothetical protein BKA65DRAFT_481757 [Rhexocercosporidium sp. MPI-PUGE-AT-0058]
MTAAAVLIQPLSPGYYRICLDRGYLRGEYQTNLRSECRTDLLDFLEAAAYLPKYKLSLLMEYFKNALKFQRRFRSPIFVGGQRMQHELPQEHSALTIFPKLPLELRTIVWTMSLPGPRILEVASVGLEYFNRSSDANKSQLAVLHIARACTEANAVVGKHYAQLLITRLQWKRVKNSYDFKWRTGLQQQNYFVSYEHDLFYFHTRGLGNISGRPDYGLATQLSQVKHIAFSIGSLEPEDYEDYCPIGLESFTGLRNVVLVGDCERQVLRYLRYVTGEAEDVYGRLLDWDLQVLDSEDALPIHRTSFDKEPDHPLIEMKARDIANFRNMLADHVIKEAYKDIKVTFELWRR